MLLSIGIIGVTILLFSNVMKFQNDPYFSEIKKGDTKDLLYSLPISLFFIIVDWIVHSIFDKRCDQFYIDREKYPDPQSRRKRCQTLVKWAYSMTYYIISSYWGFMILQKAQLLPAFLGGKGVREVMVKNALDIPEATDEMKIFYIIQFGKHFGRFLNHCFIRREGHFYEYALHHGLSSVLISFSFLSNQWLVGILVLFLHDLSEIILMIARGYADYKKPNRVLLYTFYMGLVVGWFVLRIHNFFFDCIVPSYNKYIHRFEIGNEREGQILTGPGLFMIVMLVILLIMQIFWGTLIYIYIFTRIYKETFVKAKVD